MSMSVYKKRRRPKKSNVLVESRRNSGSNSSPSQEEVTLAQHHRIERSRTSLEEERRAEALGCLQEFFLGERSQLDSPKSVLDKNLVQQPLPGALDKSRLLIPPSEARGTTEGITFNESGDDRENSHQFTLLKASDRAQSMPTKCHTSLPKKPSLKQISSIGSLSKTASESSLKRQVSFNTLQIREYKVGLSDNPSCSFGPPVGLSWDYEEEEEIPLDSYEADREPRRGVEPISYGDRRILLKQGGYSKKEVKAAVQEVDRVKRERLVTDLFLPASRVVETMETLGTTVKEIFRSDSI